MPAPGQTYPEILSGASISQLGEIFELDRRTVTGRLRKVKPSGERSGNPTYRILDAAPLLLERYVYNEQGELVRNDNRTDESAKDYWDAQLKRQKYEENAGDLWRTDQVVMTISQILKFFRESLVVFMDNLEYDSGLPQEQIAKAKLFCDNLLTSCHKHLNSPPENDRNGVYESDSGGDPMDGSGYDEKIDLSDLGLF
jgi:hypothetical protein